MRSDDEIRAAVEHAKRHLREPGNRWAAFTDDELVAMADVRSAGVDCPDDYWPILLEVEAELERRKA